jgi:hypothetical protein
MRTFTLGSGADRKLVVIELKGTRMSVAHMMPDGSTKRKQMDLSSEAEARGASEQMARELIARGYREQIARGAQPAQPGAAVAKPSARTREREREHEREAADSIPLFWDVDSSPAAAAPVLAGVAAAPSAEPSAGSAPQKKKKTGGKKKKKKKAADGDALDKRVLAGIAAVGAVIIGFFGFMLYDVVLKPPTIVGTWRGSMLEHEVSRYLTYTKYDLILDDQKRASLTLQEKYTSVGTYSLKGNRLSLSLKDEKGIPNELEYKISLGRATLDLLDPGSGKLQVQLIRFLEKPVVKPLSPPPPEPAALEAGDVKPGDVKAGDANPGDANAERDE